MFGRARLSIAALASGGAAAAGLGAWRVAACEPPKPDSLVDLPNPSDISTGTYLLAGGGAIILGLAAVMGPFIAPAFRRITLPFVPASPHQIESIVKELDKIGRGRSLKVVDLGSGDGRVVIGMAKAGHEAMGVELNRWLVFYSKWASRGLRNARFRKKNLWKFDLGGHDAIVVFGVPDMMPRLEAKMAQEIDDHTIVISARFKLQTWKPFREELDPRGGIGTNNLWLYRRPDIQAKHRDAIVPTEVGNRGLDASSMPPPPEPPKMPDRPEMPADPMAAPPPKKPATKEEVMGSSASMSAPAGTQPRKFYVGSAMKQAGRV